MPRPKLPASELKKDRNLRFSDIEWAQLKELAEKRGFRGVAPMICALAHKEEDAVAAGLKKKSFRKPLSKF